MPPQPGPPYEWDRAKDIDNRLKHGVGFELMNQFGWVSADTVQDLRSEDEERWVSLGFIREQLHKVVWTPRGPKTRIISLRKATAEEADFYAKTRT